MIVSTHCAECGKCCHFPDGDCEYLVDTECKAPDKDRPGMCDLYPFVVATDEDAKIKLYVDKNCPHIPMVELSDIIQLIAGQHGDKRLKVPTAAALKEIYHQDLTELIEL